MAEREIEVLSVYNDQHCYMCDGTGMTLFVEDLETRDKWGPYMCYGQAMDAEKILREQVNPRAWMRFHLVTDACPCKRAPRDYTGERMAEQVRRAMPQPKLMQFVGKTWQTLEAISDQGKLNALEIVRAYCVQEDVEITGLSKRGLVLSGKCGVGKSGLMNLLYQSRDAERAVWVDYNDLVAFIQSTYGAHSPTDTRQIMQAVQGVRYLFLDDMGDMARSSSTSDDRRDKTYEIIRVRHERRLPTYITTNLDKPGFTHQFGDRIAQRVFELSHWVGMGGAVLRK